MNFLGTLKTSFSNSGGETGGSVEALLTFNFSSQIYRTQCLRKSGTLTYSRIGRHSAAKRACRTKPYRSKGKGARFKTKRRLNDVISCGKELADPCAGSANCRDHEDWHLKRCRGAPDLKIPETRRLINSTNRCRCFRSREAISKRNFL